MEGKFERKVGVYPGKMCNTFVTVTVECGGITCSACVSNSMLDGENAVGLAVDHEGYLYVANYDGNEIQIF